MTFALNGHAAHAVLPPVPASRTDPAVELVFPSSTRVLWRSASEVQLELGDRRLVVDGLSADAVDRLSATSSRSQQARTESTPLDDGLEGLLAALHRAGFLIPSAPTAEGCAPGDVDSEWLPGRAALAPDLAALGERFGERSTLVMAGRQNRTVVIEGTGRLPTMIGSLLAAAGVGHVHVGGDRDVGLWDAAPGGITPADEGQRSTTASMEAIHRVAPAIDTRWAAHSAADLVVLAGSCCVGSLEQSILLADAQPYLSATVWASSAVIGPLVVPGVTSCLGCADLHRAERDPAWPALAAQLATARHAPSDVAVCGFASAFTALQALAFLDGESPATVDGTLELSLPDWRVRRRSWLPHENCPCQRR